jgi:hypothetical protein
MREINRHRKDYSAAPLSKRWYEMARKSKKRGQQTVWG